MTTKSDGNVFDDLGLSNADLLLRIADQDIEIERLRAQLEVATKGYTEAVRQSQWQARTNREMNKSQDIIHSLRGAIEEAIESGDEGDWQSARRVLLAAWKTPNYGNEGPSTEGAKVQPQSGDLD